MASIVKGMVIFSQPLRIYRAVMVCVPGATLVNTSLLLKVVLPSNAYSTFASSVKLESSVTVTVLVEALLTQPYSTMAIGSRLTGTFIATVISDVQLLASFINTLIGPPANPVKINCVCAAVPTV